MAKPNRRSSVPIESLYMAAFAGLCANPNHPPGEHPSSGDLATMPKKIAKRARALAEAAAAELSQPDDDEA